MTDPLYIQAYSSIYQGQVNCNGELMGHFQGDHDFDSFATKIYRRFFNDYPRFFKMDAYGKLGYLTTEFLFTSEAFQSIDKTELALIFSNQSASLETDRKYQKSIADRSAYYPSPGIFVYTLPNMVMGEICIKHGIQGEGIFLVSSGFDPNQMFQYTQALFASNQREHVLCSWINIDHGAYQSFSYLVGQKGTLAHTPINIENLFSKFIWKA